MRSRTIARSASSLLLLAGAVSAKHDVHEHLNLLYKRHSAHRHEARLAAELQEHGIELRSVEAETAVLEAVVEKRTAQCIFPTDLGLVAVTPDEENAGWAMSPNQPCLPGNYCPYACPPGQVSMQWNPAATSYTYPLSMDGGLYCDENGDISKPLPNNPYCQEGVGNINAVNEAGGVVSFCQTVLPGNEAMLIPTGVTGNVTLAVPASSYWCSTAAHYYINPPGIDTDAACVWGTNANPYGNWAPYVGGANQDASGNTYMKLGWNPIYLQAATPFNNVMPTWGVKITCDGEGCNGLPCAIDPTQNGVNEMVGTSTDGAGGGAFCVVTVPTGVTASYVITNAGESGSSESSTANGGQFYQSATASSAPASASSNSAGAGSSTSSSKMSAASYTSTSITTAPTSYSNSTSTYKHPSNEPSSTVFSESSAAAVTTAVTTPSVLTATGAGSTIGGFATTLLGSLLVAAMAAYS